VSANADATQLLLSLHPRAPWPVLPSSTPGSGRACRHRASCHHRSRSTSDHTDARLVVADGEARRRLARYRRQPRPARGHVNTCLRTLCSRNFPAPSSVSMHKGPRAAFRLTRGWWWHHYGQPPYRGPDGRGDVVEQELLGAFSVESRL